MWKTIPSTAWYQFPASSYLHSEQNGIIFSSNVLETSRKVKIRSPRTRLSRTDGNRRCSRRRPLPISRKDGETVCLFAKHLARDEYPSTAEGTRYRKLPMGANVDPIQWRKLIFRGTLKFYVQEVLDWVSSIHRTSIVVRSASPPFTRTSRSSCCFTRSNACPSSWK